MLREDAEALNQELPAIYPYREYAETGGLMSYGISLKEGYHHAGVYTGQVLTGAEPADLSPTTGQYFSCVRYHFASPHGTTNIGHATNTLLDFLRGTGTETKQKAGLANLLIEGRNCI
jgi:hypothetical protein